MSLKNEEDYSSSGSDPDSDDYSDNYEDFDNYYSTDDYTPIFLAVHKGDLNRVSTLLNKNNLEECIHDKRMLHVAAARGHLQIVDLLIKNGAKLNVEDVKGRTTFYIALQQNKVKVAEFLLKNGARIDIPRDDGRTTLHVAIKTQNIQIVERLLKQGTMVNVLDDVSSMKPIDFAASLNNIQLVELLLKYGAKMDESDEFREGQKDDHKRMTALHFAAERGNLEMVKLLMSNGFDKIDVRNSYDKTPLGVAISKHRLDIVKYMFESGSKINEDMSLIDLCESYKDINILKYLLDHGVKLVTDYVQTPLYYALDMHEYKLWRYLLTCYSKIDSVLCSKETELHSAVRANNIEKVQEILKKMKVNSLSGDLGQFAVYIAVENGNEEMLTILLEAGCSVESCFRDKLTPLHIAATFDQTRLVEILLKYGARINSETRALHRPLDFAAAMGNLNMIKYLIDSGANSIRKNERISSLRYLLDRSNILDTITPSMYLNLLKATELLLIAGDLKHKNDYHVVSLLRDAFSLRVFREGEQTLISDNEEFVNSEGKKGEFRPEIVRCLLNYLDNKLLKEVLNSILSDGYNNSDVFENIIEYYDSNFIPIDPYFTGCDWSNLFIVNEIKLDNRLLDITRHNINSSKLIENDDELLKLIIARLELLKPSCKEIIKYFPSSQENIKIRKFQNEFRQQIIIMQKTKVNDELNLTFYDILVNSTDKIASCIRDVKLLNTNKVSYDKFLAYKKFVKLRIEKVKRRIELIDLSTNCLYHYIQRNYKIKFSTADVEEILQYLSMSDLRKLSSVFSEFSDYKIKW
ncbi:putative ankyrin repeat protein RF_0381 [Leptopilina heterotoma]|uniref:putative ankyrin repeat protein RF_0381 n=1 Tax=Leptopilina heterotoma TaxID=63436 RepID=UPI001CA84612|nr:putative ankyrin repeat protein RF_0381 [Leptopilina heterotoma]XP_043466972.1 putative ankyrin repeat protein RF_0381 [Leptopilina heterotoma]